MDSNINHFFKSLLAGAGAGFALTGGVSLAVPSLTVTNNLALSMAALGAIVLAVVSLRQKRVS